MRLSWPELSARDRSGLLTELVLTSMAAVGVDAVILFPVLEDAWASELARKHPRRFCWVPMLDPRDKPDVAALVAAGAAAARVVLAPTPHRGLTSKPSVEDVEGWLSACERQAIPVFLFCPLELQKAADIAQRHPDLVLVVDHYGLAQPPRRAEWREDVPRLLELARYPNIYVKACGAPSLSSESYPFSDVWRTVRAVVDAFGQHRVMWASDITRFQGGRGFETPRPVDSSRLGGHTYAEALHLFTSTSLLTDAERHWILGATVQAVLRRDLG